MRRCMVSMSTAQGPAWPADISAANAAILHAINRNNGILSPGIDLIELKDALPVALLRLGVERRREGANLGVGQSARRTLAVFALRVVGQHQDHQPSAVARVAYFYI
jgi:hypothetical protein